MIVGDVILWKMNKYTDCHFFRKLFTNFKTRNYKNAEVPFSIILLYSLAKSSNRMRAFAALGEGMSSQGIFVSGKTRRVYSRAEVAPVQSTRLMREAAISAGMSFGTGFLMLASLAPVISQEYNTSQSAR